MFGGTLWFNRGQLLPFISFALLFAYAENRLFIYSFSHPIPPNYQGHLSIWNCRWLHSCESRWQSKWRSGECPLVISLKGLKKRLCVCLEFSSWNTVLVELQRIKPTSRHCGNVTNILGKGTSSQICLNEASSFKKWRGLLMFYVVMFSISHAQFKTQILCFHGYHLEQLGWQVNALRNEKKNSFVPWLPWIKCLNVSIRIWFLIKDDHWLEKGLRRSFFYRILLS